MSKLFSFEVIVAVFGLLVPIAAYIREFVLYGRKRLGYRVQMDIAATDLVQSKNPDAFAQLRSTDGKHLVDPSLVLLRIENNGTTHISSSDYATLDHDKVGIHVRFPGRRVVGMAMTEFSVPHLQDSFGHDSGLEWKNEPDQARENNSESPVGIIRLPKVKLNRSEHYKVLAVLERATAKVDGGATKFAHPLVRGGVMAGNKKGKGRIRETRARAGISPRVFALIAFLMAIIIALLLLSVTQRDAPIDCAKGQLKLVGSTAFRPVLDDTARMYRETCPGAEINVATQSSDDGVRELNDAGRKLESGAPEMLAFSDGAKKEGYPQLLPRSVAFSLFTLVVNRDAGVQNLSLEQVKRLYDGNIGNWKEIGGKDVPVRLVERDPASGTRRVFEKQVVGKVLTIGRNSDDCQNLLDGVARGVVRCSRNSTEQVLGAVADSPGAIGYSELEIAAGRTDVVLVRVDGHEATLEGALHAAYPFWETEYAYTYREPRAESLAASFLRYLTNQVGKDIVRSHGHRPCSELQNPVMCRPE